MDNVAIREWINGALIPLNVCIILMITYQLYVARRTYGKKRWTRMPGISSACAIWWVFLAELIRAFLAWYILNRQSNGIIVDYTDVWITTLYAVAAVIALLATFRLVFTLAPRSVAHQTWIASCVLTAVFLGFVFVMF